MQAGDLREWFVHDVVNITARPLDRHDYASALKRDPAHVLRELLSGISWLRGWSADRVQHVMSDRLEVGIIEWGV